MTFDYSAFISRNYSYISDELQSKIRSTSLAFIGCGIGSVVAELACRIGFQGFMLYDGDTVKISNLNRQNYTIENARTSKAESLAERLRLINPEVELSVEPSFVTMDERNWDSISDCDFVVNTIDNGSVFFALTKRIIETETPVFLPLNLGLAGANICFHSDSLNRGFRFPTANMDSEISLYRFLFNSLNIPKLRPDLAGAIQNILRNDSAEQSVPQLSVGSAVAASLVITSCLCLLQDKSVPMAPDIQFIDVLQAIQES